MTIVRIVLQTMAWCGVFIIFILFYSFLRTLEHHRERICTRTQLLLPLEWRSFYGEQHEQEDGGEEREKTKNFSQEKGMNGFLTVRALKEITTSLDYLFLDLPFL
jgi:hypothetical protein